VSLAKVTFSNGKHLLVEVADSPVKKRIGLMFRRKLADGGGMIFPYASDENAGIWMKNTHVGLDLIFANADGEIIKIAEGRPHCETIISVDSPGGFVVEANRGFCEGNEIRVGDCIVVNEINADTVRHDLSKIADALEIYGHFERASVVDGLMKLAIGMYDSGYYQFPEFGKLVMNERESRAGNMNAVKEQLAAKLSGAGQDRLVKYFYDQ